MDIQNRKKVNLLIAKSALVVGLGMGAVVSANATGYAHDGFGNVVRDGFGRCVLVETGRDFPECGTQVLRAQAIMKPPAPKMVMKPKPPVKIVAVKPKPVIKPKPKPVYKPKPKYITKVLSLNEAAGANFGFDKDNLSSKAQMQLSTFANVVKSSNVSPSTISVIGHTDSIGSKIYNQKLSERRANSVANYLSTQGLNRAAMQVSGRGETQAIASNKSKSGRAQNRRVDIRVTGQRKLTIKK